MLDDCRQRHCLGGTAVQDHARQAAFASCAGFSVNRVVDICAFRVLLAGMQRHVNRIRPERLCLCRHGFRSCDIGFKYHRLSRQNAAANDAVIVEFGDEIAVTAGHAIAVH